MRRSLRVLHVIPSVSPRDGGPTRAMNIMERALSEAGVAVTTLTTDHDLDPQGLAKAPASHSGARRTYAHKWVDAYKLAPALVLRLIEAVPQHDVVHIHALFSFAATTAAWAARYYRVPYVLRPLGTLSAYGLNARRRTLKRLSLSLIEKSILRTAAAVHFTSRAELDEAGNLGLAMRGVVIPLGVDTGAGAAAAPLQHKALIGRRVILFLSRLDPKKNLEALIGAVSSSPLLRSTCALVIAGAGEPDYVRTLKAQAASAGLSDHIVWLGHVDGAEKGAALAAADVFVLPSFSENFGIAAVEALVAGIPCLLSTGVAIAREVEQAGAGAATAPEPAAIAHALEGMLGDERLRADMGRKAAELAKQAYSAQAMARRLIALYVEIRGDSIRHGLPMPSVQRVD